MWSTVYAYFDFSFFFFHLSLFMAFRFVDNSYVPESSAANNEKVNGMRGEANYSVYYYSRMIERDVLLFCTRFESRIYSTFGNFHI